MPFCWGPKVMFKVDDFLFTSSLLFLCCRCWLWSTRHFGRLRRRSSGTCCCTRGRRASVRSGCLCQRRTLTPSLSAILRGSWSTTSPKWVSVKFVFCKLCDCKLLYHWQSTTPWFIWLSEAWTMETKIKKILSIYGEILSWLLISPFISY